MLKVGLKLTDKKSKENNQCLKTKIFRLVSFRLSFCNSFALNCNLANRDRIEQLGNPNPLFIQLCVSIRGQIIGTLVVFNSICRFLKFLKSSIAKMCVRNPFSLVKKRKIWRFSFDNFNIHVQGERWKMKLIGLLWGVFFHEI